MKNLLFLLLLIVTKAVQATDPYPRNEAIDILHYQFSLDLNDSTNRIAGEAIITIRFKQSITNFSLDLTGLNKLGQGMAVKEVLLDNQSLKFEHQNDRLKIQLSAASQTGDEKKFVIRYSGIPQDGLIISKNKFGDRTFFGDNWPNRAHHWLPTIDHPYDKATCEFIITAPEQYTIIATGQKIEESAVGKNRKMTHWKTSVVLPTKVMVFGAARFAIEYEGLVDVVPLQAWVYPQNREKGFADYGAAAKPLDFMIKNIAPYPYEKLANVQTTTRFGGMENAGNIFYYENSVAAKRPIEGLLAHEIAHQWFGNSASEADWYHVWLSEGFATYMTALYFESTYGSKRLEEVMKTDRDQIIEYYGKKPFPVVNLAVTNINEVLNTNSYEKGSFVLHMLRHEVGDQKFWEGIRAYYQQYQLSNALTEDFRKVMEKVSGKDLTGFFDQWIFKAGQPKIEVTWKYDASQKKITISVEQKQLGVFVFPLELEITTDHIKLEKAQIYARKQEFSFLCESKPVSIGLDPHIWLLFEGIVKEASR